MCAFVSFVNSYELTAIAMTTTTDGECFIGVSLVFAGAE